MSSKRLYFVLLGVVVLLGIGGIASVYFGNDQLKRKSHQLRELKIESGALEEQQKALIQAKKDIDKYSELEKIAKSIVPQEKDQARTVREIVKLGGDHGIRIASITFPASTLGQVGAGAKPSTAPPPAPGAAAAAPATAPALATTQVKAVEGIPGVYQMEVNVQADSSAPVTYQQLLDFLKSLEQSRRTSQVSNLTVTPDQRRRNMVTFSLIINVHIKP